MRALWLDLETTGLDPLADKILEIGLVVTTPGPEFQVINEKNWVLPFLIDKAQYVNPIVHEMHTKNDLWRCCNNAFMNDVSFTDVEYDILGWIDTNDVDGSPMHGSTPSFDRSFLVRWFPTIEKRFHYRSYDVSTLVMHARAEIPDFPKIDREKHRAIPDLEDSIDNARRFIEIFRPTGQA